jgi:hypothetical protein
VKPTTRKFIDPEDKKRWWIQTWDDRCGWQPPYVPVATAAYDPVDSYLKRHPNPKPKPVVVKKPRAIGGRAVRPVFFSGGAFESNRRKH